MSMKGMCKGAIRKALQAERMFPAMFPNNKLLGKVCDQYGTEFVAECMMELGLDREVI